jgi:hypothetical protein
MSRIFRRFFTITTFLLIAPYLRGAPLRTDLAFACTENTPAGTHLWCAFPDVASHWTVVMYAKSRQKRPWWRRGGYTYAPLVTLEKPAGAAGHLVYQFATIPPHSKDVCLLVTFRDGTQQPYRGWTAYNPFGWHTFGIEPPLQARVSEIPPRTAAADIRRYERLMRAQWSFPIP